MASIRVTHDLGDLQRDCTTVARSARPMMAKIVRGMAKEGNRMAKENARRTAGKHGKRYPARFKPNRIDQLTWVYGPVGRPQGEMSFEFGSRNQPPHLDLARSADLIGPRMAVNVRYEVGKLFWPGTL